MFGNAVDLADYDSAYMALTKLSNYETYDPRRLLVLIIVNDAP